MTVHKRDEDDYDYDGDRRPYKYSRLRLDAANDIAVMSRDLGDEIDRLLAALNDAYATIDLLRRRLSNRQVFSSDGEEDDEEEEEEEEEDDNNEPWFIETFASSYAGDDEDVVDLTCDSE
ncbi:hypothetical protein PI126_g8237 [Phytophthora idaei]|nr:hypothetical protein PI126_g8237 [Phytophthora idaei]